jgi:ABC-2 type transport system ATP-binding protein
MSQAIVVDGLTKRYKDTEALRGMTFGVPRGSLCGLIGLNGAGKTTTLKILMEMTRANAGRAEVLGLEVGRDGLAIRQRTAFLPEGKKLFPYMTVEEIVGFVRPFYPSWRKEREAHLAAAFELPWKRNVSELSKGTLAKLQMLLALSRGTELIILDEPTDGLDAIAVEEALQEMAAQVAEEGATVLFCSHRLEEIEQIVDYLVIVHEGRCLLEASIDALRGATRRFTAVMPDGVGDLRPALEHWGAVKQEGRTVALTVWREPEFAEAKLRELGARSVEGVGVPLRQLFVDMVRAAKGARNAVA